MAVDMAYVRDIRARARRMNKRIDAATATIDAALARTGSWHPLMDALLDARLALREPAVGDGDA